MSTNTTYPTLRAMVEGEVRPALSDAEHALDTDTLGELAQCHHITTQTDEGFTFEANIDQERWDAFWADVPERTEQAEYRRR